MAGLVVEDLECRGLQALIAEHKSARFPSRLRINRTSHLMICLGESGAEGTYIYRLEFGVGVRADFAVEIDFFMLRCGPFHRWLLEDREQHCPDRITRFGAKENGVGNQERLPPAIGFIRGVGGADTGKSAGATFRGES
jgi:hypothetical protein